MPKPYKMTNVRSIPSGTEIVEHKDMPHARIKEKGRHVLYPLSKDGAKYLQPSKRWYFDLRDANGTVCRVKGFADLKATEQLAAEMERNASRVRAGFTDPAEEHTRKPLADHLKDYGAALEAKGNCDTHVRATVAKIAATMNGCGFAFLADVKLEKVSVWLADLRRPGRIAQIPPGDVFASSDVAELLGIGVDAVRRFVARHRLPTVGAGPARRLPRATVQAVAEKAAKGIGPTTVNHYIRALRAFFQWLVKQDRAGSNPLKALSLVNAAVDVRHARRELASEELQRLLAGTRASGRSFRGLTGEDRFFLYLVAAGTGFRANALANLTPADFDLNANSPTVTTAARFAKNRRTKVQPLPADVADALRDYLENKPANTLVWGGTWSSGCSGAEMLRRDLEAVGIPYAVEGPDGPEHADFHALRHTYLTMLGRHGVDLRTAQELAGHSTPLLTARYTHRRLHDLAGAVDKLPNLVPTGREVEACPLRMTGTEGQNAVVPAVVTGGAERPQTALKHTLGIFDGSPSKSPQPLEMKAGGASQHRPASIDIEATRPGFEPGQREPKSLVLPLHYGVIGEAEAEQTAHSQDLLTSRSSLTLDTPSRPFHPSRRSRRHLDVKHGKVPGDAAN